MPKRNKKMTPAQVRAMWARKSQNAANSDLAKRADDVRPYTPENHAAWLAGGSRRFDIDGLDTPMIKVEKGKPKSVEAVKETKTPREQWEETERNIDDFCKNYPVDQVEIPSNYDSMDVNLIEEINRNEQHNHPLDLEKLFGGKYSREDISDSLNRLTDGGYILKGGEGEYATYHRVEGGYAKHLADTKGSYADTIYKKMFTDSMEASNKATLERMEAIDELRDSIKNRKSNVQQSQENTREMVGNPIYPLSYIESRRKKINKEIRDVKKQEDKLKALDDDDNIVLFGGTKKLQNDVNYVLLNILDIDRDEPKYFSTNVLDIGYTKALGADGILRRKHKGKMVEYSLQINDRYRKSDIKTDNDYLDTLTHELVHFTRKTDVRRTLLPDVVNSRSVHGLYGFKDKDKEEKETVMETNIRTGDRLAISADRGYYALLKSVDNAVQKDNRLLTISQKNQQHNTLHQVTEDLEVRGKTSKIHQLKLQGRGEFYDTFYQSNANVNYQVYTANPPKNFNPRNIAKQIDMVDGIAGNETISEWRDGKKHTVIKRET